tara:strand:- start:211 stop:1116 length:906 start_codon:yes stop_codon:yes gene_type:complete
MSEVAVQKDIQIKVDSPSHNRNIARAVQDQEELDQLMKDAGRSPEVETQEDIKEDHPLNKVETKSDEDEGLTAEEKTFKKRYGDLRKHSAEKEKDLQSRLEKLEEQLQLASKKELVLPKSTEEVEAWSRQHPDVAAIVESIADKKATERSSNLEKRMKEFEQVRSDAVREKAEAELINLHPDFEEIRNGDEFHNWAEEQPKWVKDALYENMDDAKSVARVIDLYKQDKGMNKASPASSSDKAAASSVKARTRSTPEADQAKKYLSESVVNRMSPKEYALRSDEIMTAIREGKFTYDMTKKT